MISQGSRGKYIKQIKLNGPKSFFPNKYYSPYQFIGKLNQAIRGRFDIQVIEVRYIISKSKHEKDFQDHNTLGSIAPQHQFNNIFNIEHPFMKELLDDIIKLDPPTDFNPNQYDLENSIAKKMEEEKKIYEINEALKLIVEIQSLKQSQIKSKELRSLTRFKMELKPSLKDSQVDIYVKAIMSQPAQEKVQSQKNSHNPVIIKINGKQQIRLFLHPCKSQQENSELLVKLCPITDWSLCAFLPEQSNDKKLGSTYWNLNQLSKKAQKVNQSIVPLYYIATHKNKIGNLDAIQIYSFFFNEIVLKSVISLAQIKKIQKFRSQIKQSSNYSEYYIYLAYPPRYYISILRPDTGCDDGFIRNWQRTQNFTFLRNQDIMQDEFLRLYLFNNTIVKLNLDELDSVINVSQANNLLNKIMGQFKGTIKRQLISQPWDFKRKLSYFNTIFKYKEFKDKFRHSINRQVNFQQKSWKLKYLILVLIRYNCIYPSEVQKILSQIQKEKQDIDIYVYIFWQSVAKLGTVSPQIIGQPFIPYLEKQFNQIKKLSIADITKKISSNTQLISFVFRGSLTPSGLLFNAPTPEMKGRLMKEYSNQSQFFFRISITDDNEGTLKNQKYITKSALKQKMGKITILNRQYIPLGWSPSQLRSYSLWYMHEYSLQDFNKRLKRQQVLSFLGQFDHIQNPAKKAARIGQSFSSSWTYLCKQNQIQQKIIDDDLSTQLFNFTDGIGKISADLLQKISLKLQIRDLSVLQVRYKGSKGILVLDPTLKKCTIHLRPSMIKYDCKHQAATKYLDVLDWNKYKAGFLNRQIIVLLKSLGISDKVFQKKQADHIQRISKLSFKDCSIFKHMNEQLNTDLSNLQPANVTILHLLRAGFRLQNEPFFRGVLQTMKKNGYHMLKIKCNIMIDKSARIIGIIDQWNILQEGQVFCTLADNFQIQSDKEQKRQNVQGDVIVTRNPCLHPADIRKLKSISMAEVQKRFEKRNEENIYHNYVNCIIFPKKGKIPVTSQISGSDLDGDNFFICWDKELIPIADQPIYTIDAPTNKGQEGKKEKKVVQYSEMIDFFIEYLNYQKLGQIDNSHLVHADQSPHYAKSKECMQLAIIHGKAVDFPKSGFCPQVDPKLLVTRYPDFMEKQESPQYKSTSILGQLYRDILQKIKNLLADNEAAQQKIDDDLIRQLIKQVNFERSQIRQALQILLDYEKQMTGLINLAGIDTEYQIYSGNFSIAKDKVKAFGKNRLIATILALRARYFDQFFNNRSYDKQIYTNAKQQDLQNVDLFGQQTRKRALLFYLCSYVIKFSLDENFLNDEHFRTIKKLILNQYHSLTYNSEGKYAGFVWFVVPKIIINQKYRINKLRMLQQSKKQQGSQQKKQRYNDQQQQMI